MKNNPQSSPFDYKSFGKQPQGQHYTSPSSPIPALRFIDQIDFYLWQASGDETIVLNKISGTLKNELQVAWYNKLQASVSPRKLTINDIRRALLRDFGIDTKTQRKVLSRYEGGDLQYLKGQSFKLVMNYLDEIEALKEEVGKVKESGMREKEEAVTKWKRLVMKAQVKHKAEIEKETIVISGLKEEIEDLKLTVKGLTCMLGEPELKRGQSLQKAYERHREEVQKSAERFKMVLMQAVTDAQLRTDKRLPVSYRRLEIPTDAADQHIHSNNTAALTEVQGVVPPPVTKPNEVSPLCQRPQNSPQPAFRDIAKNKAHHIHIDIKDHPEHLVGPLSIN